MDNFVFHEHLGVDFEDITTQAQLPDGYGGLNWASSGTPSGLATDVYAGPPSTLFSIASDNEVAFNALAGQNTVIARADQTDNFTLKSLDLVNAQHDGANQLLITGYNDGVATEHVLVDLTQYLTTTTLNWTDIDTIHIDVVAGSITGPTGVTSGYWGMDDLILA